MEEQRVPEQLTSVPSCCIWCGAAGPDIVFDRSHVIPSSCGNEDLVLPPPIVCQKCNSSFTKLERTFADEPGFNFKATLLGIESGRGHRSFTHDRYGFGPVLSSIAARPNKHITATIEERQFGTDELEYVATLVIDDVQVDVPSVRLQTTPRWCRLYSRAIHKILLEWYAYLYYVRGRVDGLAPTDSAFDALRAFVRNGYPQQLNRPVARRFVGLSDAMDLLILPAPELVLGLDLMGTRYACALTGELEAVARLVLAVAESGPERTVLIHESFEVFDKGPYTISGVWKPLMDA